MLVKRGIDMPQVGKQRATCKCKRHGQGIRLSSPAVYYPCRIGTKASQRAEHSQEPQRLLHIELGVEGEYLGGSLTEHHTEHEAVDVEAVDTIYLTVEVDEYERQGSKHGLHNDCSARQPKPNEQGRHQKRGQHYLRGMAETRGSEKHPALQVHHLLHAA